MGHLETARSPCATGERFPTAAETRDARGPGPTLGNPPVEQPSIEAWLGATTTTPLCYLSGEGIRNTASPVHCSESKAESLAAGRKFVSDER